ncbi:MAG: iron transporter permease [Verrucomicrobiales bacterium]|nr:iron transporter permease [Verrucomicrobiales bacterium]
MSVPTATLTLPPPAKARRLPVPRMVWVILAGLGLLLLLPTAGLLPSLFTSSENWSALVPRLFTAYLKDTIILTIGTGLLALLFGVPTAWLTSTCRFPGSRLFSWALVLPLALPGYLAVYGYHDLLSHASGLIVWMRAHWGTSAASVVEENLRYVILTGILGSVLYPYVYLTTRASFRRQASSLIEASRLLGHSPASTFRRIALPLARPAIAGGTALALMEVLNDYGAVRFFNLKTLTTGIFRYGYDLDDKAAAVRLSLMLLGLVVVLLAVEKSARGRARFNEGASHRPLSPWALRGLKAWTASGICAVPLVLGFLLPGGRILHLAWLGAEGGLPRGFYPALGHTLLLSGGTAALIAVFALLLAYAVRLQQGMLGRLAGRAALAGYGMPGAVVALAVTLGLIRFSQTFGLGLLSGTFTGLILAYMVRFLAVSYQPLESGLQRVCGSLDDASRTLGIGPWRTLRRINLPLLRGPLLAAMLLTFIDLLKELPITLLLRPHNFSTLATRAWDLQEQSQLPEACVPAVIIIGLGALGSLWLHHSMERK